MSREFGGEWTKRKLDLVENYLRAYLRALSKQRDWARLGYIDAFAGSGSIKLATEKSDEPGLLDKELQQEVEDFIYGSAVRALALEPAFDGYVFLDTDPEAVLELNRLRKKYPARNIDIRREDANTYLQRVCNPDDWSERRAVVFLDPAGMQVEWETLKALAETEAIDVWIWFPLGVAVNRLLTTSGDIEPTWAIRLDRLFGSSEWRTAFYKTTTESTLFGNHEQTRKVATPKAIASHFNERLRTIFPAVAPNPCIMRNSKNNPLYALCFASANPGAGGKIAVNIASHLLDNA